MNLPLVTSLFALTFVLGCTGGPDPPAEVDHTKDVRITSCTKYSGSVMEAYVNIKNPTDQVSSYMITVEALDPNGTRVGQAVGISNSIGPKSQARVKIVGTVNGGGPFKTCRIAKVSRING